MKWVQFEIQGQRSFGILSGDRVTSTSLGWDDILRGSTPDLGSEVPLSELRLLAPVGRPSKIVAIGLNYMDHCREQNVEPPKRPLIFTKFTTSIIGPGDTIRWSSQLTKKVDYEAELAAVIGKRGYRIDPKRALEHVFGYTAANDVSARDLQFGDGQWVRGKSLNTFCPLGPHLVTADVIPDPQVLGLRCDVNGKRLQDSNTSEMVFGVAELVTFCSQAFTLEPGDIILTGTPNGVGAFRDPPLYLKDGDQVVVEIEGLGRLENTCEIDS